MKILYEDKHTNEGLTKAEKHNKMMDRIIQDKRDRDARMSKFLKDNSDITGDELKKVQDGDRVGLELKNRGLHDRYWNEVEGKNESLKRNPKLVEAFYRGAKGVEFVGHGEWSDPELIYNGYSFNYWDIEDALWHDFLEETGYSDSQSDDPKVEAEFDKYVQDRATDYLDDCIFGGAGTPIDESLEESYTKVDIIECGEDTYRVVGGGFNPTADALVTVEDEHGDRTRMHIGDVIEFYTWYDKNGNVIHEPSEVDESVKFFGAKTKNNLKESSDVENLNPGDTFKAILPSGNIETFTVNRVLPDAYEVKEKTKDGNMIYKINKNQVIKESKTLTEDFDEDERIQALAEYLGIDPSEITNIYDYEYETPEGDYLVVDEDEARELAEEDIENLFDDLGLDSFTPDFKDWIIMNALDTDWFEEAVRESYEYYVEDIEDEASSMGYENRLIEEMHDHQVLSDDDFEIDEDGEPNLRELKEGIDIDDLKEEFIDLLVENAGHPVEYYADNFGWDEVSRIAVRNNLIDIDEVVDQCIYEDGVAHFIARYDGEEHELGNGLYAYRTN